MAPGLGPSSEVLSSHSEGQGDPEVIFQPVPLTFPGFWQYTPYALEGGLMDPPKFLGGREVQCHGTQLEGVLWSGP